MSDCGFRAIVRFSDDAKAIFEGNLVEKAGDISCQLIEAIYTGNVSENCREFLAQPDPDPADNRQVNKALASMQEIVDRSAQAQSDLANRLNEAGFNVEETAPIAPSQDLLALGVGLSILASELAAVLNFLGGKGFRIPSNLDAGAIRSLKTYNGSIHLVSPEPHAFRLTLFWRPLGWRPFGPLTPSLEDYSVVKLPAALWWAYPGVHLSRRIVERLTKRRYGGDFAAVNLPTPKTLLADLCKFAGLNSEDYLLDFGAGDGRVLIEAVSLAHCLGLAIEVDQELAGEAQQNVVSAGLSKRITVLCANAFDIDLSKVTVVFLFQPPSAIAPIMRHLLATLKPGSRIVAHEQASLRNIPIPKPERSKALFSSEAVSVAHLWRIPTAD